MYHKPPLSHQGKIGGGYSGTVEVAHDGFQSSIYAGLKIRIEIGSTAQG